MRCFWNLINIAAERLSLHFNEAGDDEGSSRSSVIFLCYHRFISSRWCIHKHNKNWDLLALRPWHQNWDSTVCVKKYAMAQQTKITIMHLKLRFICASPIKRSPLSYERRHNFLLYFGGFLRLKHSKWILSSTTFLWKERKRLQIQPYSEHHGFAPNAQQSQNVFKEL